ncbi:MAG: glycosyltransferase [Chloroflexota bacterium]|jgi:glycosyltransferase involved in cell wall biosynthesis
MTRFCLIGPTYPYRGGIAHYTTLLARHLAASHETLLISFSRQYPGWLFPGRSDRDPSRESLRAPAEYLLDPLNPLSWRRCLQRIDQWDPDVVVIPWWVPFWAPAWATIGYGVKRMQPPPALIFICHNVLPHESKPWDVLALRLALRSADGFVVHSRANAEELVRYFPTAGIRVTPLPTYATLSEVRPATLKLALPVDRPLLLFTGFVRPYKGLDILLEAMPRILENRPVHLLVAGEFWQSAEPYLDQIQRLGIGEAVTVENRYLSNEELAAILDRADVVVLPYRTATQSAIVQLAFGSQKPVITTDVGGLAEVVEDGRTGLVVPPEDPAALAAAVIRYFDEDLGPTFQEQIEVTGQRFSWQRLERTIMQLVDPGLADEAGTAS